MTRLANVGLSVLLLGLVAVALAVAIVPAATGTKAVTIDRNSMQSVLPLGSLVYIVGQPEYTVGDIVTYRQGSNHVTHQIVGIHPNPANAALDGTWFTTKGTSNPEADPYPLNRADIVGKVINHVPYVGTVLKTVGTQVVQVFLGLLALGLYLLPSALKGNTTVTSEKQKNWNHRDDAKPASDDAKLDTSLIDADHDLREDRKDAMASEARAELATSEPDADDVEPGAVPEARS